MRLAYVERQRLWGESESLDSEEFRGGLVRSESREMIGTGSAVGSGACQMDGPASAYRGGCRRGVGCQSPAYSGGSCRDTSRREVSGWVVSCWAFSSWAFSCWVVTSWVISSWAFSCRDASDGDAFDRDTSCTGASCTDAS